MTRLKSAFRNYVTVVLPEFDEYGTGTLYRIHISVLAKVSKGDGEPPSLTTHHMEYKEFQKSFDCCHPFVKFYS